jgi:hypothetical protein
MKQSSKKNSAKNSSNFPPFYMHIIQSTLPTH